MTIKFSTKRVETSPQRMVQNVFRYLEPFRHRTRITCVTDRCTEQLLTMAQS